MSCNIGFSGMLILNEMITILIKKKEKRKRKAEVNGKWKNPYDLHKLRIKRYENYKHIIKAWVIF